MINQIQKRPQSKSYKTSFQQARPITRSGDQEQAQKCFQMGKEHYNRNDIQKAEKFYLEAIVHNPGHFKSYCNLGLCYKLRGQYPNSIQAYKQSLAINSQDSITNYNLANVYRLIGNEDKSIAHYLVVINLKQKDGVDIGSIYLDSYNNLGICYKNIENYAQAIECFEKILKEKPSEDDVKFNLAVCYLRVVRRMLKNSKAQNIMLVKENITKTTNLFQQVLKKDPKNQVATLALIELSSVSNQQHQNIKKCVTELEELMKRPQASGFVKEQGSKVKAYCLNLLAKYEQSAEEYRKAMQKKKQEEERKMAQEKQKQRVLQEKQQKQRQQALKKAEQQKQKATSTKVAPPAPQPVQTTKQQPIQPAPVPQINPKQVFQAMVSSLVQKLKNIIQDPAKLSQQKNLTQTLDKLIQSLQKQHLSTNKDKKLTQRIRKQLSIVGCSVLGENLVDKEFFSQAFDTYINYFLQSNLNTQVNKSTLFLSTHRAIASVLTSLGQSQKAIQHYQIISQQFTQKNIHDKDPLQQLHSGLAVNYQSQGLHEKAIKEFQQAIRLNPSNYVFYYNLGYCQHCAGKNVQAVKSYSKFLQEIQKQTTLQNQSKQSYILQALISIFICSQGSIEEKLKKCSQIQFKIEEFCGPDPKNALKIIDPKSLMQYYLLACDLYEQLIFDSQKSASKQSSKAHKQKLFTIYINLLQLPNCPDRDQILINCGNLLFQQKQFFGALHFYQKVSKSKTQVYNILSLTLLNINQHQRALSSIQYAQQCDKSNHIYEVNYEIMKWAYGLEIRNKENLLWERYPCRKDVEFDIRVEYAKSLVTKLTAIIEKELAMSDKVEGLGVERIFKMLLDEKDDTSLWKDQQALQKHNVLKEIVKKQCGGGNANNKEEKGVDNTVVKSILQVITTQTQTTPQNLTKTLSFLTQKLTHPNIKQSPNYLNILQQSLALFIYHNSKDPTQLKTLNQHLTPKSPLIKTYQLTFPDPVTPSPAKYPQKNYTVVYPSIQLRLENLIQSLMSWNTMLEEKFVYLMRIVESVAYRSKLRSPLLMDYNFACCKYVENCEKCFKKAVFVLAKMFNIDCKQNFITSSKDSKESKDDSLKGKKKAAYTAFVNKFGKNLQPILTSTPGKDTKTLSLKLNQQTLPLQMQLNFMSQLDFQTFLKTLCTQLSAPPLTYDKNDKQLYLILNKLIRVRCSWKETDFVQEFISTVVRSTLGLRESAVEFFDEEILKQWAGDETLKGLLQKVFDVSTFLK